MRDAPTIDVSDCVEHAVRVLVASGLPAVAVVDANDRSVGTFGERECLAAMLPGWVDLLSGAAFVPRDPQHPLALDQSCRAEPVAAYMNPEDVGAGPGCSDLQIAETFLHHPGLILPVVDRDGVRGVVTRSDFVHAVARRFLG
ncbi:MAG: CBS domain-containing protein [Solirubrobacteraceae bacterium]|nr:CBS domain-containing protein [Solirubrobacteraceae bacterium]